MRPFESHYAMGAEAWLAGKDESANPHAEGTLARVKWLEGHLSAMVESGDLGEVDQDCAGVYLHDTALEARRMSSGMTLDLPSANAVADAIGLPVRLWRSKCYAVSVRALESGVLDGFQEKHGRLFPAYGIYTGPVSGPRTMNRHGWLESVEGHVVDPTRWVFTGEYPGLWLGPVDDYDLGGMRLRAAVRSVLPPAPEGRPVHLGINDPSDMAAFDRVLRDSSASRTGAVTVNRLHWVMGLPLELLGPDAAMFYRTADRLGLSAYVPLDNRLWLDFSANGYQPERVREGSAPAGPGPRR